MTEGTSRKATEKEIFELLKETRIGVPGLAIPGKLNTVVCDDCSAQINDGEFVQLVIAILSGSGKPIVRLRCAKCRREDIRPPTRGVDEWLVDAKVINLPGNMPKLQSMRVIRHSPPEEGTIP